MTNVNVSLKAVTAICELLSRPMIPVGRQLIDRQLNRKRDRHVAEELSGALLFLLAHRVIGRQHGSEEVNFWLASRGKTFDANDKEIHIEMGLERQVTFSIITDTPRFTVPEYVMELEFVQKAFVTVGNVTTTVNTAPPAPAIAPSMGHAKVPAPAPTPAPVAAPAKTEPAATSVPPKPLLTLDKAILKIFNEHGHNALSELFIRETLIEQGYGSRMAQFRTRLALVVSRSPNIKQVNGAYTYSTEAQPAAPATAATAPAAEQKPPTQAAPPMWNPPAGTQRGTVQEEAMTKKKVPEDWRTPTTYLKRFGDAMQLLCQGHRPSDEMLTAWLKEENEELQSFAVTHCPMWAQGIGTIDAARCIADQPTEGVDHEMFEYPKAEAAEEEVEFDGDEAGEREVEFDGINTLVLTDNDTLACTSDGEFLICNADGKQIFSADRAQASRLATFFYKTDKCYD